MCVYIYIYIYLYLYQGPQHHNNTLSGKASTKHDPPLLTLVLSSSLSLLPHTPASPSSF